MDRRLVLTIGLLIGTKKRSTTTIANDKIGQ